MSNCPTPEWEEVEMTDDELNEIDPTLTQRIMARHPEKYIASPDEPKFPQPNADGLYDEQEMLDWVKCRQMERAEVGGPAVLMPWEWTSWPPKHRDR